MLEKYDKDADLAALPGIVQKEKGFQTKAQALAFLQKEVPREAYFQKKIIEAVKARYADALVIKVAQGFFSEPGIPDILCIIDGHYFGIEVKRPLFGKLSSSQEMFAERIKRAGGTAVVACYPEEAIERIEAYFRSNKKRQGREEAYGSNGTEENTGMDARTGRTGRRAKKAAGSAAGKDEAQEGLANVCPV